ncbi:MAG: hypothetical protein L3J37_00640 [Rhodobacteraceae bacterium]|nr:hypothetical protein [Paracoccaceae bacterium]
MKVLREILSRFKDDDEGTVTVEFIIILPVLILWWIGSMVFFDAFEARAGAARVSHLLADIVSRQNATNNAEIDDLLTLQNKLLPREPVGNVRVSEIYRDSSGDLSVNWSYSTGGSALETDDIPTSILPTLLDEQYVMLIETAVPYIPLADWVGIEAQTWVNRIYINARFSATIPNSDI